MLMLSKVLPKPQQSPLSGTAERARPQRGSGLEHSQLGHPAASKSYITTL